MGAQLKSHFLVSGFQPLCRRLFLPVYVWQPFVIPGVLQYRIAATALAAKAFANKGSLALLRTGWAHALTGNREENSQWKTFR
jgi:hypothetical protein